MEQENSFGGQGLDFDERLLSARTLKSEDDNEFSLRPKTIEEYIGQEKAKENLRSYIQAAK